MSLSPAKDPTLANEIKDHCGATHLEQLPLNLPDALADTLPESNLDNDDTHNDSNVPLITVLCDALGDRLNAPSTMLPVATVVYNTEPGGMSATNDKEDIWDTMTAVISGQVSESCRTMK
ncbi:hypothetical protein K438DRAFT_1766969 [Mycena galopus ATCC 62051]|nr:hypothetical protein K438DRAFT_1766969 [Mycena galopus ATCC 62051]